MAKVGSVIVNFSGNTAEYQAAVDRVRKGAKDSADAVRKGGKESESAWESQLRSLKKTFGKKTLGFETFEVLKGGGAAAGLSIVGSELSEATTKLNEFVDAYREGKLESGELFENVAKTTPLFGSWFNIGRQIREFFTDEAFNANKIAEEQERITAAMQKQAETALQLSKYGAEQKKQTADLNEQLHIAAMSEFDRPFAEASKKFRDEVAAIKEKFKEPIQSASATELPGLQKRQQDDINEAQERLAASVTGVWTIAGKKIKDAVTPDWKKAEDEIADLRTMLGANAIKPEDFEARKKQIYDQYLPKFQPIGGQSDYQKHMQEIADQNQKIFAQFAAFKNPQQTFAPLELRRDFGTEFRPTTVVNPQKKTEELLTKVLDAITQKVGKPLDDLEKGGGVLVASLKKVVF